MKKAYSVKRFCAAFGIARSTYYDWVARRARPLDSERQELLTQAAAIHSQSRASYGYRRMSQELRLRAFDVGHFKARNLMREAGLKVKTPRPPIYPKSKGKPAVVASNVLNRQFDVTVPGTVFAGDITYIATQEGWLYLAVVMDLCARRIVGWEMSNTPDSTLTVNAIRLALGHQNPSYELLFHSDQGCQYTSLAFQNFLRDNGIKQSMSRRGNCWDNAPVERFFRSLKTEWIGKTVYASRAEAEHDINRYIAGFYNTQRLHSAADNKPPAVRQAEIQQAA